MKKHRFEIRLADINRVNLDAALVGLGDDSRENFLGFVRDDRDFVIGGDGFENILHAVEGFRQRFGVGLPPQLNPGTES